MVPFISLSAFLLGSLGTKLCVCLQLILSSLWPVRSVTLISGD